MSVCVAQLSSASISTSASRSARSSRKSNRNFKIGSSWTNVQERSCDTSSETGSSLKRMVSESEKSFRAKIDECSRPSKSIQRSDRKEKDWNVGRSSYPPTSKTEQVKEFELTKENVFEGSSVLSNIFFGRGKKPNKR